MNKLHAIVSILALAALPLPSMAQQQTGSFSWALTNRFRLLSQTDEQRFGKDFEKYKAAAAAGEWGLDPFKWQLNYARLTDRPYKSGWMPENAQYDLKNYVQSQDRAATLSYSKGGKCSWTVNGKAIPGTVCNKARATLKVGSNTVTVSVDGAGPVSVGTVNVQDFFVVVLGDSTGSGEGNPEVPAGKARYVTQGHSNTQIIPGTPALWLDERCHRSLISSPLIAMYQKSHTDPHQSVTVVDYACSGAEIDNGIMDLSPARPYQGRETKEQLEHFFRNYPALKPKYFRGKDEMLPDQINVAEQALCQSGDNFSTCQHRPVNAVIIVTGANDLHFADVLEKLILDCPDNNCLGQQGKNIDSDLSKLDEKFQRLHDRVKTWQPAKVLLLGYMDPTHDAHGKYCDDNYLGLLQPHFVPWDMGVPGWIIGKHLGSAKSKFAEDHFVSKLTDSLTHIASNYKSDNWTFLATPTAESVQHGICADKRWDLTYGESSTKQGILEEVKNPDPGTNTDKDHKTVGGVPSGAMHPNVFGHLAMADAILAALKNR